MSIYRLLVGPGKPTLLKTIIFSSIWPLIGWGLYVGMEKFKERREEKKALALELEKRIRDNQIIKGLDGPIRGIMTEMNMQHGIEKKVRDQRLAMQAKKEAEGLKAKS